MPPTSKLSLPRWVPKPVGEWVTSQLRGPGLTGQETKRLWRLAADSRMESVWRRLASRATHNPSGKDARGWFFAEVWGLPTLWQAIPKDSLVVRRAQVRQLAKAAKQLRRLMERRRWAVEQVFRANANAALPPDQRSPLRLVYNRTWKLRQEVALDLEVDTLLENVGLLSQAPEVGRESRAPGAQWAPRKRKAKSAERTFCILAVADLLKEHFSHSSSEIVADLVTVLLDEQGAIEPDLVKKLLRAR